MLALISFITVIVGAINWFCIGLLQFDFVAGLFGSQSSIFSRIVYIAVGLGALVILFNLIENKGKIKFNFKKKEKKEELHAYHQQPQVATVEAGQDYHSEEKKEQTEVVKETGETTSCDNGSCKIVHEEKTQDTDFEK
ncbi:MAG: DUF378 domain-containing protein [Clostridiales bacterium]|nr:DUF378 domain-containing protein [Clostridiales bacterium]